ncbi:hypothetical protein [Marivivens donghaensis]|uniref:hypothetical protein n=1 Tax=Marivivens donghaensis TaxID=1699413 RepID=UPI003F6A080E
MRFYLSLTPKTGTFVARRARRGVSLFAVMLGMFLIVAFMDMALQEVGRQQKRNAGRELANISAVLANRWERLIHKCAVDALQFGTACAEFSPLAAADWSALNVSAAIGGRAVSPVPAALRVSGTEPAWWSGALPIAVTKDVSADLYIASVGQAPIATGLIVFRANSDLHPLTLADFRAGLDDWNETVADADEITPAEAVCAAITGCVIGPNDTAVLTYPFVKIESDWLLREPWVGRSFAHEMQADIASAIDPSTGAPIPFSVLSAYEMTVASGEMVTGVLIADDATVQSVGPHDDGSGSATYAAEAIDVEAQSLSVSGTGTFAGDMAANTLVIAGGVSAGRLDAASSNATTDASVAGNLFAETLSVTGTLSAEGLSTDGQITGQSLAVTNSTVSDNFNLNNAGAAALSRVLSSTRASSLYASLLQVTSLTTSGCTGC